MNLNFTFRFFEMRILISIRVSIKIETNFEFVSAKVYQINRGNHHSNKQKFPCFDDVIMQEESVYSNGHSLSEN